MPQVWQNEKARLGMFSVTDSNTPNSVTKMTSLKIKPITSETADKLLSAAMDSLSVGQLRVKHVFYMFFYYFLYKCRNQRKVWYSLIVFHIFLFSNSILQIRVDKKPTNAHISQAGGFHCFNQLSLADWRLLAEWLLILLCEHDVLVSLTLWVKISG